jgi:hypothetical protein
MNKVEGGPGIRDSSHDDKKEGAWAGFPAQSCPKLILTQCNP